MEVDQAVTVVRESLMLMLKVSTPILLAGLVIGLIVSILQAVTQIQEQTLSFVPKILGMALATILIAPWATEQMIQFSQRMFGGF